MSPNHWPELFRATSQRVAEFFHVDPDRLLFSPSCTAALAVGITDHAWQAGDRVITSHYEHHALYRPLTQLQRLGVETHTAALNANRQIDLHALEQELKSGQVRMVAMTAACNVTGHLLPVAEITALAHRYDCITLVDGAQIAGWWSFSPEDLGADIFTFAGHKGLHGLWGIGGIYVAPHLSMSSPAAACERPTANTMPACATMPGYCDVGSANVAALAGLAESCRWLQSSSRRNRLEEARQLADQFSEELRSHRDVTIHANVDSQAKMPTVAMTVSDRSSIEIARQLADVGVIVSGGFQCAPQAHLALGTSRHGVVRFSFGPGNNSEDIIEVLNRLKHVLAQES